MASEKLLHYLTTLNDAEKIYKEYNEIKDEPKKAEQFINALTPDQRVLVMLPPKKATFEDPIEYSEADYLGDYYFNESERRSVYIWNIFRYTPPVIHRHDFFEMMYVAKGQCEHTVNGEKAVMTEGTFCLFSPAFTHSVYVGDDESLVIQCFVRKSAIENTFFELISRHDVLASFLINSLYVVNYANYLEFQTQGDESIKEQLLQLYEEEHYRDEFTGSIVNGMFMTFLLRLIRNYGSTIKSQSDVASDPTVMKLYHILIEKYDRITLPELAKELNYSTQYCSSFIKKTVGLTFSQLLRTIRMQNAKRLLTTTSMSVAQVGLQVGYEYPESFIRSFRKEVGVSPSEYKATQR